MNTIRTLVLVAFAATALSACMPDSPQTQLTWDANTGMTKGQERAYNEPARLSPSYDNSYSSGPRTATRAPTTKVYAYNDKAPVYSAPLKAPAYASPSYTSPVKSAPKTHVYQDKYAANAPPRPNPTYSGSVYSQDGYDSTAYGTSGYSQSSYSSYPPSSRQSLQPGTGSAPRFDWPISGRVISNFGTTSSGGKNDGINISAPLGAPIHASAAGTVTYSGNELRGYGNLLLIRHPGGYTTAYANADRIVVNKGELVSRGQIIGYAGQTGDVTAPQLHFEIRRDTTPVDPRGLLASSTASND